MIPVNSTANCLPSGQVMTFGNAKVEEDWTVKVESNTAAASTTNMNDNFRKKKPLLTDPSSNSFTDPSSNSLSEVHDTSIFPYEHRNIYQMSRPSQGAAMMPNQQFSPSHMIMHYSTGTPYEKFMANTAATNMPDTKIFASSPFVERQSPLLHPKKATMKFPMKVRVSEICHTKKREPILTHIFILILIVDAASL